MTMATIALWCIAVALVNTSIVNLLNYRSNRRSIRDMIRLQEQSKALLEQTDSRMQAVTDEFTETPKELRRGIVSFPSGLQ